MATNERRRERYALDETYRERRVREVRERREAHRAEFNRRKRLRGWEPIASCPDDEVVLIYDPKIFWPVVASLRDGKWDCVHYDGVDPHPTHWRRVLEVPLP